MSIGAKERATIANVLRSVPGAEGVTAVVFGSQARGDASDGSDIDIGLRAANGMPLPAGLLSDIQDALDDSPLVQRVEVVDLARTSQQFRDEALSRTIAL